MIFLLFILNSFAITTVDNCTENYCIAKLKENGVTVFEESKISNASKSTWLSMRSNPELLDSNVYSIEFLNGQSEKDAQDYAAAGAAAKGLCDKVYHMVMGYNISRNFDTPTLNQMKVDFMSAKTYLQDCQVLAAKAEIQAITADPAKFTQEFKDMVLNEFSKAGY